MKNVISFKVPNLKHRAHRVLFQEDTPFKPKVVKSKLVYKRREKHRGKDLV